MSNPIAEMKWDELERDIVERIHVLRAVCDERCDASQEVKEMLWHDLVLPNLELLSNFCSNVKFTDEDEGLHGDVEPDPMIYCPRCALSRVSKSLECDNCGYVWDGKETP